MKIVAAVILGFSFFTSQAEAQQAAPADGGPSLAVTMQFLADKLKEFGWQQYTDGVKHNVVTITKVTTEPVKCLIHVERENIQAGGTPAYVRTVSTTSLSLRNVESVSIVPGPTVFNEDTHMLDPVEPQPGFFAVYLIAQKGTVSYSAQTQVSIDGHKYKKPEPSSSTKSTLSLGVRDEQAAGRTSMAMQHAVSICSPKAPPPPPAPDTSKKPTDPF